MRGLLAILFGFVALANPGATAMALVIVFAAWAFADGVFAFVAAARRGRAGQRWGWFLFEGLVSVGAGVVALAYPHITLLVLVVVTAVRAIVLGMLAIGGAMTWQGSRSRWIYGLTGVVSILFGAALLWRPLAGALALIWTLGVYAIVFGVMMVALGIHIRGMQHGFTRHATAE